MNNIFSFVLEIALLFALGLIGWFLLSLVRLPASEVLGPALLIGALRVMEIDLPTSPGFLFQGAQVVIGIFVGSMLTRDTLRELKPMALSAMIIVSWALSIVFFIGFALSRYSELDLYTAMLSASMGGLPEITVIAIASGAGVAVIVIMQLLRLLGTIFIFPLVLGHIDKKDNMSKKENFGGLPGKTLNRSACKNDIEIKKDSNRDLEKKAKREKISNAGINASFITYYEKLTAHFTYEKLAHFIYSIRESWLRVIVTLVIASAGGVLVEWIGVPAGLLVGSTVFVGTASVLGVPVSRLSTTLFNLLLVLIGITIADIVTPDTFAPMGEAAFLVPILLATAFMFATSFLVAWIIYRITSWDFATSFLAAAPGGFTVMTALAIKYNRDPFKVSMLHLCRLLSINIFIPLVFMFLMRR